MKAMIHWTFPHFIAWLIAAVLLPAAEAMPLDPYRSLDPAVAARALNLSRTAARHYLERGRIWPVPLDLPPLLLRPAGVFVTVLKEGKTRGCWGTMTPRRSSLAADIIASTIGALRRDGRFRPVNRAEWPNLAFSISIVGPLVPVRDPGQLQPRRFGLLVSGGGRSAVLLPGEARTARWQIAECRRKAGLPPGVPAQMFLFETVVLGPIPAAGTP